MVAQSLLCVPATFCWSLLPHLQVCLCVSVCVYRCAGFVALTGRGPGPPPSCFHAPVDDPTPTADDLVRAAS